MLRYLLRSRQRQLIAFALDKPLKGVALNQIGRRYEGASIPPRPAVAAAVILVKDLGALKSLLADNGVMPIIRSPKSLWVSPVDGNGAVIEFIEA